MSQSKLSSGAVAALAACGARRLFPAAALAGAPDAADAAASARLAAEADRAYADAAA
jgi:hypothetical protein